MTKYTANLPERLNVLVDGARNIGAGASFSNPQGVFDASESIFHAGIDALAIAVFYADAQLGTGMPGSA